MTAETFYKVIMPDGSPTHGGSGLWPLPSADAPGAWREVTGDIVPCSNGLHVCTADQLAVWADVSGAVVYRAETAGPPIDAGNKYVARKVRLLPGPIAAESVPDMRNGPTRVSPAVVKARAERDRIYDARRYWLTAVFPAGHTLAGRRSAAMAALAAAEKRLQTVTARERRKAGRAFAAWMEEATA